MLLYLIKNRITIDQVILEKLNTNKYHTIVL